MVNVRLDKVPKLLMSGSRNGRNYQRAIGVPKSDSFRIVLRKDQCVTSSFYLGFFKRERLAMLDFDISGLTMLQKSEFRRAVDRSFMY